MSNGNLRLALSQIVIGLLITGFGIYVARFRFPLSMRIPQPGGGMLDVEINPGPELFTLHI
jgi:hypothetical protein